MVQIEKLCKYILPCGWCDKYDKNCYTFEKYIREQIKLNEKINNLVQEYTNDKCNYCNHTWMLNGCDGNYNYFECINCHETKREPILNN